jgi:type II secretory ATPase GspE/PulE/Tfp pilus assembly ATPase PilB-like protein/CheY-like chemotaxis protein
MVARPVRDSWLLPTLESLLAPGALVLLAAEVRESYWEACIRGRFATDGEILAALAARFRMTIADLSSVSAQARDLIPEPLARRYHVLPLAATPALVDIATADPRDLDGERALAFAAGRRVRLQLASPARIAERIEEVYRSESAVERLLDSVTDGYDARTIPDAADDVGAEWAEERASARPVMRLVDHILAEAIAARASDVHVETEENEVAVNGSPVDLRVSTLPSAHGEKVVIRVLDRRATALSLDALGMTRPEAERIDRLLAAREGLVLVTGPTGSGKTTTLYTILRRVQERGVNVVTVEDPVEYRLQGIVQVQVNPKAGLTFAAALRSILRQDPDVVLIGEIRDRETAEIAIQASLTGHLVFSTLHTIDSTSAVARLADLGVESYKLAAALKGVIAQRLLRRLCPACRRTVAAPLADAVRPWLPPGITVQDAPGCTECAATGYRGRLAASEVLVVDREVERRIAAGEPVERIADAARAAGMQSLWDVGVAHLRAGATSVDELLRVIEPPTPRAAAEPVEGRALEQDAGASVLLVADDPSRHHVTRAALEGGGITVYHASIGAAADALARSAPGVVVLDPGDSGASALSDALALVGVDVLRARSTPLVVLAAGTDEAAEIELFAAGATDVLSAPPRPLALAARLRALLARG